MFRKLIPILVIVFLARSAHGVNRIHVAKGSILSGSPIDVWGYDHPGWRTLSSDQVRLVGDLKPAAVYGVNTVGLCLQDPARDEQFFLPDGGPPKSEQTRQHFTELVNGIREHYMIAAVSLFSADRQAWLESPEAYRKAVLSVVDLLPYKQAAVIVVGDLFGSKTWSPDAPYPMTDPEHLIALCRLIKEKRNDCVLGIPANVIANAGDKDFLYVAQDADAMAAWIEAVGEGKDPRKATSSAVAIPSSHFLLSRDTKGDFGKTLQTFGQHVEKTRFALPMPPMPSSDDPHEAILTPQEKSDGWVPLFDGKSLQGWTTLLPDWGAWTVENGEIRCRGIDGPWLRTTRTFEDFILRLEFKIVKDGNSGIFVYAPLDARCSRFGMEMQIRGKTYEPPNDDSTGAIYDVLAPRIDASNPPGEWNQVEFTCSGAKVSIRLNGKLVQDFDMNRVPNLEHRLRKGLIGLQDHGCDVSFRRIRIKELNAAKQSAKP